MPLNHSWNAGRRGRRLLICLISRCRFRATKADVIQGGVRAQIKAIGRALKLMHRVVAFASPRRPTQYLEFFTKIAALVVAARIGLIPNLHPLRHVAGHIEYAVGRLVGGVGADRRHAVVPHLFAGVGLARGPMDAPGKLVTIWTPRGLLPLGLAGLLFSGSVAFVVGVVFALVVLLFL